MVAEKLAIKDRSVAEIADWIQEQDPTG